MFWPRRRTVSWNLRPKPTGMLASCSILVNMNQMDTERRAQVVRCLVEGNSIRATVRMTGAAKNTVVKLLCDLGQACADYQFNTLRNLNRTLVVQVDEIWHLSAVRPKLREEALRVTETLGHTLRLMPIQSLLSLGSSVPAPMILQWTSCLTWQTDCRPRSAFNGRSRHVPQRC